MARINLVARLTGVGIDRDVDLVAEVLAGAGHDVVRSQAHGRPPWRRWLPDEPAFDADVHFERVHPRWWGSARRSWLIPNQERFPQRHLGRLARVDHVLCKTRHAVDAFAAHHRSVQHVGFTSPDRALAEVTPDYRRPLHVAGRSTLKGTAAVLAAWAQRPHWPELVLVQHPDNAPREAPANVRVVDRFVDDSELRALQNCHGLHVCPSRAEGWGHYIVEAMACRAVVVTTDAAPMNELVAPDRGVLIATDAGHPRHLGRCFDVDVEALVAALDALFGAAPTALAALGDAARRWYEINDATFRHRLATTCDQLIAE